MILSGIKNLKKVGKRDFLNIYKYVFKIENRISTIVIVDYIMDIKCVDYYENNT